MNEKINLLNDEDGFNVGDACRVMEKNIRKRELALDIGKEFWVISGWPLQVLSNPSL